MLSLLDNKMVDHCKPHAACATLLEHIQDSRVDREKTSDNFRELYNRTNDIEKQLVLLNTHLETIGELSKVLQRGKGAAWLITTVVGVLTILSLIPGIIDLFGRSGK